MLKKSYFKYLIPLLLLGHSVAQASIDGWYGTAKLGGRLLISNRDDRPIGLASLGVNAGYQFSKPLSVEMGFFGGETNFFSATEGQNVNYSLSNVVVGIKSIFYSYADFDFYTKVGLGCTLSSEEDLSKCIGVVTQLGFQYLITPEIPVGLSFSLISTLPFMFLISIDAGYYLGAWC